MSADTHHNVYVFPECCSVVICGDIHGDFNLLVNKVCVQYQMKDTLVIVAGDCGFGFERKGYYKNIVRHNAKRLNEANNWLLFIRGNHDNPAYFDGKTFRHKRFICIPDYSVVKTEEHTILCIGGAVSVDRQSRKEAWEHNQRKARRYIHNSPTDELLSPNYYWEDEAPVFNEEALAEITSLHKVDTVVTHTAPSFCELQNKNGLLQWAIGDANLLDDVQKERKTMDAIYEALKTDRHTMTHWYYGHFHQSRHSSINGVLFKMLDIMELAELISQRKSSSFKVIM